MTKRGEGGGSGGGEYSFYKLYKYALPHRMCFFFNLTRSVNCYSSPSSLGIRYVFQSLKPLQLIRVFFFLNSMSMIEEVKEPKYIINKLRRRQDTFGGRFRSGKCYKKCYYHCE